MFNSLLGYLFCLFATTLHFKLFQQETMVEMMTNLGNTSQSLLDNQKKILAGGPTPTTTRIIKIPATCSRSYGGAVVNTPPPCWVSISDYPCDRNVQWGSAYYWTPSSNWSNSAYYWTPSSNWSKWVYNHRCCCGERDPE